MGKIDFTSKQKVVIEVFKKEPSLVQRFYLTGGTALSVFYLGHRWSEDLDFFSEKEFNPRKIINLIPKWAKKIGFEVKIEQIEDVLIFKIEFRDGEKMKIDFNYYPYKRLKKGKIIEGLMVDSLFDIAVNKLLLINQRTDIKDFVDLYFLEDRFTIWDLMEGVRRKFGFGLDPILVAADFMKAEEFDFLPQMLVSLEISSLQSYFKKKAREISGKFVE